MTGFDKIRSMSDEELCKFLAVFKTESSDFEYKYLGHCVCDSDDCPYFKNGKCDEETSGSCQLSDEELIKIIFSRDACEFGDIK